MNESLETPASVETLAASLLARPPRSPPVELHPVRERFFAAVVSLFISYHIAVLILYNLPAAGLSRELYVWGESRLFATRYIEATGNAQTWGMFAPNPVRANVFVRVLVHDTSGDVHDLRHDIYGHRRHPYLLYEHMGKVNQRLGEESWALRTYAAWVCRAWERDHHGEPAQSVQMVSLSTSIPTPSEAPHGFDPRELQLRERTLETFDCDTLPWAQLPPRLRERYGLEPVDSGRFKPGIVRTWADRPRRGAAAEPSGDPP